MGIWSSSSISSSISRLTLLPSLEYLGVLALETCFYALLVDSVKEKPGGREMDRIYRGWILVRTQE